MNETTEKCSPARYARTILKVAKFLVKSDSVVDEKGLVLDNTKHIFEHNKPAPGLKDDLANRIKEAITWEESQALQRPNFLMCSTPKGDRVPAI